LLVLGLDFETTGIDPYADRVLEVGLALWDVERRRPVCQSDFFVQPDIFVPKEVWDEVTPIHGICQEDLDKFGVPECEAIRTVNEWVLKADAVVAHNGTMFDKLFFEAWNARNFALSPAGSPLWIDTRLDTPEPMTGSLVCIAAKKGFLNPFPHQALSDVLAMLRILDEYDFPKVLERARIPNILVEFVGPFESKEQAKENGFYWNGYAREKATKQWLKTIKETDFDAENERAKPYKIKRTVFR
jgi:DNA polymerase-3 subunit epsilon